MKRQRRMFLARAAMTLLLALLTTVGAWAENLGGYNFDTEGEGASKVYLINNETDLENLAAYVNAGNNCSGLTFKLNAPITMTAVAAGQSNHTPIGNYENNSNSKTFRGTFDGNNKIIDGMTIYMPNNAYVGLFGYLSNGAVVKDLTLTNCHITGKNLTGGIAGITSGGDDDNARVTIENCHVSGENIATVDANYHGGIAGQSKYTNLTGCTVSGTLSGVSGTGWGGIIGGANGNVNVTSCENAANITLTTSVSSCGGIVGQDNNSGTYRNCLNRGTVSAGSSDVGAISGHDSSQNFTNCYYVPFNNVKAFVQHNSTQTFDATGNGEAVYTVTTGSNISAMTTSPDASVTSAMTGTKYYKTGEWTLTLTPVLPAGYELTKYTCEGGVLDNNDETLLQVADGDHTLVISNANVTIDALVGPHREDITGDGFTLSAIPAEMRWRGTGVAVEPAFTLRNGETLLAEGTDYTVAYTNNTAISSADGENAPTITITGINGYKGTITRTFAIADFHLLTPDAANSEENPYQVATEDDLEALASLVNTGTRAGGYYEQTQPITMTQEHTAIGIQSGNHFFNGHYNGGNKTISNLTINKPNKSYQGLFGDVENSGTIKYVVLDNCDITGGSSTGGIVGYLGSGEVAYCTVSGAIKVAEGQSADCHGGIAGYNGKTVRWCVNTASVTGAGACHGGICGEIYWTQSQSQNNLNMGVVEGTSYVGSFCGKCNSQSHEYANNYHTVNTTGIFGSENAATGSDPDNTNYKSCAVAEITVADGMTLTPSDDATYTWGERVFYKRNKDITLTCTVPGGRLFDHYEVSGGTISNPDVSDGSHQLTALTATPVEISTVFANAVTATTSQHGTLVVSPATQAPDNTTVTVTPTPDAGYTVGQVVYNDGTADHVITADANGIYSFVMPAKNVTVSATFTLDPAHLAQSGDTYTVIDATGWNVFCDLLATEAKGYFTGKTVKLGADNIEVSRCAGSGSGANLTESDHPFTGTFDGQGNTLVFNYGTAQEPANEDYIAPFRYTDEAIISGLHVSGNIYTQHVHAGGIIGLAYGTTNISDCRSSVNIISSINGDGTHGGIMACSWTGSTTNIEGCLFDGSIQSASGYATDQCGGFVGWKNGTINVTNCLLTADLSTIGSNDSYTFVRRGVSTINNSYYTAALGTAQGKAAHTVTAGDNVTMTLSGMAKEYGVSGITAYITGKDANDKDIYGVGILYNNKVYAGNGDNMSLTLSNTATTVPLGYQYGYSASAGTLDGTTLTMPDEDVIVSLVGPRSDGQSHSITYMKADGTTDTHDAIALDGNETMPLAAGWYFVGKNINYTQTVTLNGDVTIILSDGCTMNISTSGVGINGASNQTTLTIYGQADGDGNLSVTAGKEGIWCKNITINSGTVNATTDEWRTIAALNIVTINGGKVTATYNNIKLNAIYGAHGVVINGGQVTATGTDNGRIIECYSGSITLGWTNNGDYIHASSYDGTVKIAAGKRLAYTDDNNVRHVLGGDTETTLTYDEKTAIAGKTLVPVVAITLSDGLTAVSGIIESGDNMFAQTGTTVTVSAASGFTISGDVTYTPAGGEAAAATDNGDGTWSFTVPAVANVAVTATVVWPAVGGEFTADGLNYEIISVNPYKVMLSGYSGKKPTGYLSIPAYVTYNDITYTMTKIGEEAFLGCTGLTTVTIPYSTDSIGSHAFADCTSMTLFVTFANAAPILYGGQREVFGNHANDLKIAVPNISYDDSDWSKYQLLFLKYGYGGDVGLSDVNYGQNVRWDKLDTDNNDSYETILIYINPDVDPNSDFSMGSDGFYIENVKQDVTNVTNVLIENGVTTIGGHAFEKCSHLASVDIPNSVTTIGTSAFADCPSLTSVIIPKSVNLIKDEAYGGCTGLTSVTISATTPPTLSDDVFPEAVDDRTLYVPQSSYMTYQESDWNHYFSDFRITFTMEDNANNDVSSVNGYRADVTLSDRTLYKDGDWNTLCLPFNVDLTNEGCPLYGATAKTLTGASVTGTTVSLTFGDDVTTLTAGTPYIIKWAEGTDIVNPVFTNVTIDNSAEAIARKTVSEAEGKVKFIGYYHAFPITSDDTDIYYISTGNQLQSTGADRTLNACRAYFQFSDDIVNSAREIVMRFADDEATAIHNAQFTMHNEDDAWYTVDGRKLSGKPTRKGLYIFNGKKIVIK